VSPWAAKPLAFIGRLPDTLTDRSIVIPMRRRAPDKQIERYGEVSRRTLAPAYPILASGQAEGVPSCRKWLLRGAEKWLLRGAESKCIFSHVEVGAPTNQRGES